MSRSRAPFVVVLLALVVGLLGPIPLSTATARATVVTADQGDQPPEWESKVAPAARATDQRAVVVTSPTSRAVQRDGTVKAEFFTAPQFRRTATGAWRPLTGEVAAGAGVVRTESSAVPTSFDRADRAMVSLDLGARSVSMRLLGARGVEPDVVAAGGPERAGVVRFPQVMSGVTVDYLTTGSQVKERLRLATSDAPREFIFLIDDPRHRLGEVTTSPEGAVEFSALTAEGMAIGLAAPMAWSAGDGGEDSAVPGDGSAWQRATEVAGGYRVEVGLDPEWADDASFPVVLDPTLTYSWAGGTMATAFGRTWYDWLTWNYDEQAVYDNSDCAVNSCSAVVAADGSVFVVPSFSNSPGHAGHVRVDLSSVPWSTRISRATLRAESDGDWSLGVGIYPATGPFQAGDRVPAPDGWNDSNHQLVVAGFEGEDQLPSGRTSLAADVTEIVQGMVESGAGDQSGFALEPWCVRSSCQSRLALGKNRPGKRRLPRRMVDLPSGGTWLHDISLVVEYEGAVLPPPLPVDQTFGCPCGEWGTGSDATEHVADPIQTAVGQSLEIEVDAHLASPGGVLPWARVYNGGDETDGPLGVGWTHSYNASLAHSADADGVTTAVFRDPTGGRWRWTRAADGTYVPGTGVTATLAPRPGGGWRVTSADGRAISFDEQGRELSDLDRRGVGMRLAYDGDWLTSLTDAADQVTRLTYGTSGAQDGKVVGVSLPGGRSVSYGYTAADGSSSMLTSVTDLRGKTTTIAYGAAGQLTGITDPAGHTRAVNTYDDSGRIVSQVEPAVSDPEAGPDKWRFDWQDAPGDPGDHPPGTGIQTTTDPDGVRTRHFYYGHVMFRSVDDTGATTGYTYDGDGNLVALTDPLGHVTTMTYDDRGNLLSRRSPSPVSTLERWTYDAADRVTSHTDGAGQVTRMAYDAAGSPIAVTDPLGGVRRTEYNAFGLPIKETSPAGRERTMTYDAAGNLTSSMSPSGAKTAWTYDAAGNQLTETTPRGNGTRFTHDAAGRVLSETAPDGTVTKRAYDAAGRESRMVVEDPAGRVLAESSYTRDAAGRVLRAKEFDRTVVTNTYTRSGRLSTSTDAEGRETHHYYDPAGRSVGRWSEGRGTWTELDAAGRVASRTVGGVTTRTTYDAASRPVSSTVGEATSRTAYDAAHRPTQVTDPDGGVTTMSYDDIGRLVARARPGQAAQRFAYDADGNRVSQTSPSGMSTRTWTYNPDGQVATTVDPRGNVAGAVPTNYRTAFGYDADGNQTSVTDQLGRTSATTYDQLGQQTASTDPLNRVTKYAYDRLGQLATVTAPDNSTTRYGYDKWGQRISRTDARGNRTTYTYNRVGQPLTQTDPLGRTKTFTYGPDGRVAAVVNARGQTVSFGYDEGGRVTSRSGPGLEDSFRYDERGQLAGFTDATGTTALSYNGRGLLTGVDQPGADDYRYAYNATGLVTSRTYPSGSAVSYTYTADGLVASQTRAGRKTAYAWDRDQRLTRITYPGQVGRVQTRAIDRVGRVASVSTTAVGQTVPVHKVAYVRNAVGSPTRVTHTRGAVVATESFAYASRHWLARWCPVAASCTATTPDRVEYSYDKVGNQTRVVGAGAVPDPGTVTSVYDKADQRTSTTRTGGTGPGTIGYAWDADGNLVGGGRGYDALGRLVSAGGVVSYGYNATGQRRSTSTPAGTTGWSWDLNAPLPVLAEETGPGGVVTTNDVTPEGWALSSGRVADPGGVSWFAHDALGSVTDTFTGAGTAGRQVTYDPWGVVRASVEVTPGAAVPGFGYASAAVDSGTGVWHLRARDYDPALGSFMAPDPAVRPLMQSWLSTYSYADGQPSLLSDPSGRCSSYACPSPSDDPVGVSGIGRADCAYSWNRGVMDPLCDPSPAPSLTWHIVGDLVGIVFPPADLVNAVWYAAEGDAMNAGISVLCTVPIAGDGLALIRGARGLDATRAANGAAPRLIGNSAGDLLETTRVTIPEGKFGYLLKNPSKSGVFKDSMGFDQAGLDSALRSHLMTNFGSASASVPMTGGGTKFVVRGPLTGPSGQTWNITSAWGVDVDGTIRLITATP